MLEESLASFPQASVENELKKFMLYASRPLSEFKKFEALEMLEALQNVSHNRKHEREGYYCLVYQTARSKVELLNEYFRSLLLRLLGDKDHERVFDTVTKVEKNFRPKNRTTPGRFMGPSAGKAGGFPRSSGPRCFYCQNFGHLRANCFKRIADQKANAENPPPTK